METFLVESAPLKGTSWRELEKKGRKLYESLPQRTTESGNYHDRYVYSIFFDDQLSVDGFGTDMTYMQRVAQRDYRESARRIRLLPCAIELLKKPKLKPEIIKTKSNRTLYRFIGQTSEGQNFFVNVLEWADGRREFLSVFPKRVTDF